MLRRGMTRPEQATNSLSRILPILVCLDQISIEWTVSANDIQVCTTIHGVDGSVHCLVHISNGFTWHLLCSCHSPMTQGCAVEGPGKSSANSLSRILAILVCLDQISIEWTISAKDIQVCTTIHGVDGLVRHLVHISNGFTRHLLCSCHSPTTQGCAVEAWCHIPI